MGPSPKLDVAVTSGVDKITVGADVSVDAKATLAKVSKEGREEGPPGWWVDEGVYWVCWEGERNHAGGRCVGDAKATLAKVQRLGEA